MAFEVYDNLSTTDSRLVAVITSSVALGRDKMLRIMIATSGNHFAALAAAKYLYFSAVFVSMLAVSIRGGASPVPTLQSGSTETPIAYPNTPEGLRQLLMDAVAAAKQGDETRVDQIVRSLVIPDYKQWFADTLNGSGSWAEAYESLANSPTFGVSLKCRLHELARRTGTIIVDRKPDNELGDNRKPLEVIRAEWRDGGSSPSSEPQWSEAFVWANGGFRWYCIWRRAVLSNIPLRVTRPAMPQYPYPVDGKHPGGVVRVSFVVRSDGTVTDVKPNGSPESTTDPKLIRAATDAVKQFRFSPPSKVAPKEVRFDDIGVLVCPTEPIEPSK